VVEDIVGIRLPAPRYFRAGECRLPAELYDLPMLAYLQRNLRPQFPCKFSETARSPDLGGPLLVVHDAVEGKFFFSARR